MFVSVVRDILFLGSDARLQSRTSGTVYYRQSDGDNSDNEHTNDCTDDDLNDCPNAAHRQRWFVVLLKSSPCRREDTPAVALKTPSSGSARLCADTAKVLVWDRLFYFLNEKLQSLWIT